MNPILMTDGYKPTHWLQYPVGTKTIYSYLESRGGIYPYTVFFGLQYYLNKYLSKPITSSDISEAAEVFKHYYGTYKFFNYAGWNDLLVKHQGRLPLRIRAVPEGTIVPVGNVLMTIENTDPEFYWLTNYVESTLLKVWYPTTVATQSYVIRRDILKWLEKTGTPGEIDFKLHDFGYRGVSSEESAAIGGAAHLLNFNGTDTLSFVEFLRDYYQVPLDEIGKFGGSVPAAEHSTITSWGKEGEAAAYLNMLNRFPEGIVAVVSDSYDIMNAVQEIWGRKLRDQVIRRQGITVIRPDSGDPPKTVLAVVQSLAERFGAEQNSKGYLVLNPKVRVIQGDGINRQSIESILATLAAYGYSADNVSFGMGGALLQQVNRDTQKFAFKCSAIEDENGWRPVWKEAPGKNSKRGKLALLNTGGIWTTQKTEFDGRPLYGDMLTDVFYNGSTLNSADFDFIRSRARTGPPVTEGD